MNPGFAPKLALILIYLRKTCEKTALRSFQGFSYRHLHKTKRTPNGCPFCLAEKEGFEPSNRF